VTITVEEALERLNRVVDPRVGIVRKVELARLDAGDPPVQIAESHPARLVGHREGAAVNEGGGAALDGRRAIVKALAESVERYCAAFPHPSRRYCTWSELGEEATPPEAFSLFSEQQYRAPGFPFERFDRETPVQWVRGRTLLGGEPRWVPAAFVHLPHRRAKGEPRITTSVSTGLAAGADERSATVSALLEAVERDAFMLVWRHRVAVPEIDLAGLAPGPEAELVAVLRSTGMGCRTLLLTLDLAIPVVLVVLQGRTPVQAAAVLGAGAAADPRRALRLALEEACLSLFGINRLMRDLGEQAMLLPDAELSSLSLQSTAFALRPELVREAPHLFGGEASRGTVSLLELERRFAPVSARDPEQMVEALGAWAGDAVAVDCTTPDIRDVGFRVVRVVVPGLRPLDHDAGAPHLGGRRWLDLPWHVGPHPFP
jgi:ribosomal protein S12 methylthiotransferase accessory factor